MQRLTSQLSLVPAPHSVTWLLGIALASGLLGACASTPVPSLAAADTAVQRASIPSTAADAPAELRVATAKLAAARTALLAGDNLLARNLAAQAEIDARVAEMHAQAVRSRKAADESQSAARALNEELQRKTVR
jgi:Domain of unknown function (DUF4398)